MTDITWFATRILGLGNWILVVKLAWTGSPHAVVALPDWLLSFSRWEVLFMRVRQTCKVYTNAFVLSVCQRLWVLHGTVAFLSTTLRNGNRWLFFLQNGDIQGVNWCFSQPLHVIHVNSVLFSRLIAEWDAQSVLLRVSEAMIKMRIVYLSWRLIDRMQLQAQTTFMIKLISRTWRSPSIWTSLCVLVGSVAYSIFTIVVVLKKAMFPEPSFKFSSRLLNRLIRRLL